MWIHSETRTCGGRVESHLDVLTSFWSVSQMQVDIRMERDNYDTLISVNEALMYNCTSGK